MTDLSEPVLPAPPIRLIEAEGRTVPQLDGQPWPQGGINPAEIDAGGFEFARYIRNRLRDGDLIEVPQPEAPQSSRKKKD
jgi:hypothetical protein